MPINSNAGRTLYFARQYEQAIEQLRKTLDMDPNFPLTLWYLGMAHEQVSRPDEAIAELLKASLSRDLPTVLGGLGHAYAVSGKRAEAHQVLEELQDLSKRRYVSPFNIALIHAGLGDKAQAFEWLDKAYQDHSQLLSWVNVWPQFDGLRGEPRFQDLVRRMGLKP